jgi:hypothetical protein
MPSTQAAPATIDSPVLNSVPADGASAKSGTPALATPDAARQGQFVRDRELAAQIDLLDLVPIQRTYLKQRWLSELTYLSASARRHQRFHYLLQVIIIVGGVTIPALVGLRVGVESNWTGIAQGAAFVLGLVVAIAAALEGFFRWGDRWRHFRLRHEQLMAEGWAFLELAGVYARFDSHQAAFKTFVTRTEDKIGQEVQLYITEVVRQVESEDRTGKKEGNTSTARPIPGINNVGEAASTIGGSESIHRP